MYILKLFVFLLFSYIYSYCGQLDFIKFENTDKNNAILKAEKKNKLYEYVIKYKFEKFGYTNQDNPNTNFFDTSNEDKQSVIFTNSIYLNDNIWIDLNINYENSLQKKVDGSLGLLSQNRVYKQQSLVKLYFKPNSILTTNLIFEGINKDSDIDINTNRYRNNILNDEKEISFNTYLDLDFIDIYTKFYQTHSNYNKLYKDIDSDYNKNKNNLTRGIELTFEKNFFNSYLISTTFFASTNEYDYLYEKTNSNKKHRIDSLSKGVEFFIEKNFYDNLILSTTARFSSDEIKNSSKKDLIGNRVENKANNQYDIDLEYRLKKFKFFSKLTHISSRYANEKNSEKLNAYTIATLGSSFYTKLKNSNLKFDFNIRNIFNKKYFIDSDTQGENRNYFLNMIMKF
ncbi:hypothetical protein CPU12_11735 [Malaciobacter molluscorum LMG 25693]|uniref:Uncharacterized protein n=1 Tax=Malaciobacter molluscorum LMG 25693 TaxID=870501 RepID=A0A2G1DF83_9BACT|nr:TonB-dependent receptor [Malaciobacter molluscorum]AXX91536.1 hypothetical protein AMOL_0520 [Malaciobacter molluscorum LMG 25693]PHO17172.1 hypothetical protein CPU12_11735 [Malaciobacter molluscorum LMG 25693]